MEPKADEADGVYDKSPAVAESFLEEESAGGGRDSLFDAADLLELHFSPELDEVNDEESEDHDAEDEHVFRGPLDGSGAL